MRKMKRPGKRS